MDALFYEFDKIHNPKKNGYIFQYIHGRRLSNIYHYHDFYELIYIVDGKCEKLINAENINIEKGDILFLRPYESHKFISQTNNVKVVCLSVRKDEFERVLAIYGQDEILLSSDMILFHSDRTLPTINFSYDENDCRLLLCSFLNMYIHRIKGKEEVPKALLLAMSEMKKEENLKRGIDAFTELSNYSQSHLTRLMKKHFDMNIHDYILNIRLEKAYNDIIFTKENLEEISESVGYSSFSHFNKIFKEKYNITPAMLRKQYNLWTT